MTDSYSEFQLLMLMAAKAMLLELDGWSSLTDEIDALIERLEERDICHCAICQQRIGVGVMVGHHGSRWAHRACIEAVPGERRDGP